MRCDSISTVSTSLHNTHKPGLTAPLKCPDLWPFMENGGGGGGGSGGGGGGGGGGGAGRG